MRPLTCAGALTAAVVVAMILVLTTPSSRQLFSALSSLTTFGYYDDDAAGSPPSPAWPTDEDILAAVAVAKQTLRIFVYDVPDDITAQVPRQLCYEKSPTYFQAEQTLVDFVNRSAVRTYDEDAADLFLVPHDFVCSYIGLHNTNAIDKYLLPLLEWVQKQRTFQRSNGTDHVFIYTMDNGVFCEVHYDTAAFRDAVRAMIIVGNYGVADSPDCFRAGQDVVIPQWHTFHGSEQHLGHENISALACSQHRRDNHVFFKGQIIPGHNCSQNVRSLLADAAASSEPTHRFLFNRGSMRDAYFGLAPAGWACWSTRLYDALFSGTVPIIVADPVVEPYERFLDWRSFTVKITTDDILPPFRARPSLGVPVPSTSTPDSEAPPRFLVSIDAFVHQFENATGQACDASYLQQKRNNMTRVIPWLEWEAQRARSAYNLLLLELWCRTGKGARISQQICQRASTTLGSQTYW